MKKNTSIRKIAPAKIITLLFCCWGLWLPQSGLAQGGDDDVQFDRDIQLQTFDQVWQTIKKSHWEPDRVGDSWDQARAEFRPKVESAKDIATVRSAINDLLDSLGQSHFAIFPKEEYTSAEGEDSRSGNAIPGLEIRLVDEQLVVTRVRADYPAAKAGVKPGWVVKLIGRRTSDELLAIAKKVGKQSVIRTETAVGLVCDARAAGPAGEKLAFAFIDNDDQVQLMMIELAKPPGIEETFGNLPATPVHFESKLLGEGDIGYLTFNYFLGAPRLIKAYNRAIKDFSDKKGLVIDLRGNRGGIVMLVSGMCNWLATEKTALGKMSMAGGSTLNLSLNPRKPRYPKPVAVLTDACSISSAEIMAGGIKDLKLGRIFGGTTAGLSLPSTVVELPNGDRFQYAVSAYHSASGEAIEGRGVVPDEAIQLTRQSLQQDSDPVLAAATRWILEQTKD